MTADHLDGPIGGVHPVGDGELVAQRSTDGLNEAERDHDADPLEQLCGVVALDPVVDGGAHAGPDERLGHHPDDAEDGVQRE